MVHINILHMVMTIGVSSKYIIRFGTVIQFSKLFLLCTYLYMFVFIYFSTNHHLYFLKMWLTLNMLNIRIVCLHQDWRQERTRQSILKLCDEKKNTFEINAVWKGGGLWTLPFLTWNWIFLLRLFSITDGNCFIVIMYSIKCM